MTDIIVTMPKSKGGLKHLQEKIAFIEELGGYAWWWVKRAKDLRTCDHVHIVSEGRLWGCFTIKFIIDSVELRGNTTYAKIIFRERTSKFHLGTKYLLETYDGVTYTIKEGFESINGRMVWIDPDVPFNSDDIEMLLDIEKWYREGMQTIFFSEWIPNIEQPDYDGFQGFRYLEVLD